MIDEKIQKALAAAGFGSRRGLEKAIEAGEVTLNGKTATIGARVRAGDKIQWRGQSLTVGADQATCCDIFRHFGMDEAEADQAAEVRVILYNKPEGQICSRNDPEGRPSVFDHLPQLKGGRWISVGRLDFNTSGLLLFTTNGELANKLMHPSANIDREYLVRVQGTVEDDTLEQLRKGVQLDDGEERFTDISRGNRAQGSNSWFYCTIMEGRNREVRRLWESQNLRVSRLKRVRYGPLVIPSFIAERRWLELGATEVSELYRLADIPAPRMKKPSPQALVKEKRLVKKLRSGGGSRKGSKAPQRTPRA